MHNNYHDIIEVILKHNHEVEIFTLYKLHTERYDVVEPHVLGFSKFFNLYAKIFNKSSKTNLKNNFELRFGFPPIIKLFQEILKSKADYVVVKNIDSLFSLYGMLLAKILMKKVVIFFQIDKYREKPISYSVLFTKLFFGSKVITPLLGDRKYINKNNNLYYVPFVQKPHSSEKYLSNKPYDHLNIICVGKFQKRKNQIQLLRIINDIKSRCDFKLHLIGQRGDDEYLTEIKDFINDNDLDKEVVIKIDLDWRQMQDEYLWANLYILPSYKEPASVSVLEAMSFGIPVICTNQNGTRCYIESGKNGYIYNYKDNEELKQYLQYFCESKELLKKMSLKSLELVELNHQPEKFYQDFIEIISR